MESKYIEAITLKGVNNEVNDQFENDSVNEVSCSIYFNVLIFKAIDLAKNQNVSMFV